LIDQARKYNVATIIAHQRRSQLDAEHRQAPLGAANLVVFTVLGADADELAQQFDHTPPEPEIVGLQEVKAPAAYPVEYLVQYGHRNPAVLKRVEKYLRPIYKVYVSAVEEAKRYESSVSTE